ncbi:hypothetical protein EON65_52665 [archaeon]|nr:MAG: hypothetical protein EON65_52665 [archaeon]
MIQNAMKQIQFSVNTTKPSKSQVNFSEHLLVGDSSCMIYMYTYTHFKMEIQLFVCLFCMGNFVLPYACTLDDKYIYCICPHTYLHLLILGS